MFTYTDAQEEDRLSDLCSYVASVLEDDEVQDRLVDALDSGDQSACIEVVVSVADRLVANEAEESVLNATAVFISSAENADELATKFATALAAAPEEFMPETRLRVLTLLFNSFDKCSKIRLTIFSKIVEAARNAGLLETILAPLENGIDQWLQEWGATIEDTRNLYKHIHVALLGSRYRAQSMSYLKKLLMTYQSADASSLDTVKEDATAFIAMALSTDVNNLKTLHSINAVEHLKDTPAYALFTAVAAGDVAAFKSVVEKNSSLASDLKLDSQLLDRNVHMNALGQLVQGKSTITFAEVATSLAVSEDEVESWVIDAMSAGILEASIDEVNSTITVIRVADAPFGDDDWKVIQKNLEHWKSNVASVVLTLREVTKKAAESSGH